MTSAFAQTKQSISATVEKVPDGTAYVVLNGRKAIHLQKSNGTLKPADRAKIIADRLNSLLPKVSDLKAITSKVSGANGQLIISGTLVAVATPDEAKARSMTTSALAAMWTENLRKILSGPPIAVDPANLLIPLGEKRTLTVKAYVSGEVSAEVSDGSIIKADSTVKVGSLVVEGLALGETTIKIRCGGHEVSVPVSVRKYAASLSGSARTSVTGYNPPTSLLVRAVRDVIRSAVAFEPGAAAKKIEIPSSFHVPHPTRSSSVTVIVEADGPTHIPVRLPVEVEIENRRVPKVESKEIWFSNVPETVRKFQVLFTGKLAPSDESTRLLYHHYNDMTQCMGFVIDVVNPGAQPAELHMIEGVAEPMADVVIVGYVAGRDFLHSHEANVGRIIRIPPGTRRVLVSQPVHHPKTASGIMEFRQLSGDPLVVRLVAKPDNQRQVEDVADLDMPIGSFDLSRVVLSDGVFPRPRKVLDLTYTVGKQWGFIRMGQRPIKHDNLEKELFAFGITYDANVTLENPTEKQQKIEVLFTAGAGPAAGIFLIDGKYSEIKRLGPPSEREIGAVTLNPGQTKKMTIRTIPLSGSAYPTTITIRAAK